VLELAQNQFLAPGDRTTPSPRAGNVNTADEVPDSSWFTNRIGSRPMSIDELVRGPGGEAPDPTAWTITHAKSAGASPGFTARDAKGQTYFISFDAPGAPESATGAIMVANKIFWALGYYQVENFLTRIDPAKLTIGDGVTIHTRTGGKRPFTPHDLRAVLGRAQQSPDGTYRAIAALQLPGKVIGNFKYYGTRTDDPNDIVPHLLSPHDRRPIEEGGHPSSGTTCRTGVQLAPAPAATTTTKLGVLLEAARPSSAHPWGYACSRQTVDYEPIPQWGGSK
jgi:hypothetical protein